MVMNAQHKVKSSKSTPRDLRIFLAAAVEGVLVSKGFVSSKDAAQTGAESTLETARHLPEAGISERALIGADKIMAHMGEVKPTMSRGTDFARKLTAKFSNARLNGVPPQEAGIVIWAVKVYMDATKKPAVAAPVVNTHTVACNAERIVQLFAKAHEAGLQKPRIRLKAGEQPVSFQLAPPTSKNPGCIYVSNGLRKGQGNVYFGKITPRGEFVPSRECCNVTRDLVVALATNPVETAAAYGKLTGACCFCGRELTDGRSVAVGYGEICSDKFGLPWGDEKVGVASVTL